MSIVLDVAGMRLQPFGGNDTARQAVMLAANAFTNTRYSYYLGHLGVLHVDLTLLVG
jgi:non-canonical (house-cleaning) NTP pyrophosphatase